MAFTTSSWEITPIEDPMIAQDFLFDNYFSIIFNCTEELIRVTQPSYPISVLHFPSTTTTASEAILVPLTDLISGENTSFLHETFSSAPVPLNLLDRILPDIVETARKILSEGCHSKTREIVVNLRVTHRIAVEDSDFYNDDLCQNVPELAQLMNLLERSKINEQDDDAECAICLENFGNGNKDSSVQVVRTNCSHVFHDRCMLRWLRRCANCQSPYSCPLCRCIVFPTSKSHDE